MIRRRLPCALLCALLLAPLTVAAQTPAVDPLVVMDQLGPLMQADDMDGIFSLLSSSVRAARESDSLSGDWAFVFSLFADHMRNVEGNAVYALRLADEGLDLLARSGDPDPALGALLNTSRAYALADLGRLEEAVIAARLAAPHLRKAMGDDVADDLLQTAQSWSQGELTIMNTPAEVLSGKLLDQAYSAVDTADYGRALGLAAQALLPDDTGIDRDIVLSVNGKAAVIRGRALYQMGRLDEALATLQTAADTLWQPGWPTPGVPLTWATDPAGLGNAAWELAFWLGRVALDKGATAPENLPLAARALALADQLADNPTDRRAVIYASAALAESQGDPDRAERLIADYVQVARTQGDLASAALAGFYLERTRAMRQDDWLTIDTRPLIRATEAVLTDAVPQGVTDTDFVLTEAAHVLVRSARPDVGLDYARRAMVAWNDRQATGQRTELEAAGDAARNRVIAEILLYGASRLSEDLPGALCPEIEGRSCVIIVETP